MSHELSLEKTNVNIVPVDNMGDAREASQEEAANTGGLSLPGSFSNKASATASVPQFRYAGSERDYWKCSMRRSVATSPM